jgi:hypothetical protein
VHGDMAPRTAVQRYAQKWTIVKIQPRPCSGCCTPNSHVNVGWCLGHWFVAVRTVSKIGLKIRWFWTCKWFCSVFLKKLYREATNQSAKDHLMLWMTPSQELLESEYLLWSGTISCFRHAVIWLYSRNISFLFNFTVPL